MNMLSDPDKVMDEIGYPHQHACGRCRFLVFIIRWTPGKYPSYLVSLKHAVRCTIHRHPDLAGDRWRALMAARD